MTHIDLINRLNRYKNTVDEAYKADRNREFFIGVDSELFKTGILKSFGKRVILNKDYKNFVDYSLNRSNLFIKFDDYTRDLEALVSASGEFIKNQKDFFKTGVIILLEELYDKVDSQDRSIKRLVESIYSELSFDIDILISQSNRILNELNSLLKATQKISIVINENLINIDLEIDSISKELLYNLEEYIENIEINCSKVSEIIIMSKARKEQSKKLSKLAHLIREDRDEILIDYLKLNQKNLLTPAQKILSNPSSERDREKTKNKIAEILKGSIKKPKLKKVKIKEQREQEANFLDLENILEDLNKNGCEDLFLFLKGHEEIQKYLAIEKRESERDFEEIFFNFLTLVIPKNPKLIFKNSYNSDDIKVVKWIA